MKTFSRKELVNLAKALGMVWAASPGWTVLGVALIVLQSLATPAVLYLTRFTINAITQALLHPGPSNLPVVTHWILLTTGASWAALALRSVAAYANEIQGEQVSERVQEIIARKATQVDFRYYEDPKYFDTLHQAQLEAPFRPARIISALAQILQSALSLVAIAALVLLSFHWTTVLLVAGMAGLGMLARLQNVRLLYRWRISRAEQERQLSYVNWLLNAYGAAKEMRLYGLGPTISGRAARLRESMRRERMTITAKRTIGEMVTQACAAGGVAAAFYFLARRTLEGALTVGDLVMNLGAFQRGAALVQELIGGASQLYEHALFINRFFEFLELEQIIKDPAHPKPFPALEDAVIRFEGVEFRYPSAAKPVLDGLDLTIRPGEMVALVGENGAGKSTIIKLLCRLYDPTGGRITIGGIDVREFTREDLWAHMALLFQDFMQYQATAKENIAFGACQREQSPKQIQEAAAKGGAEEFIGKLPQRYQQTLGTLFEGGVELSGGQWQKIALSRAFYRDAPIVILDEPTSALDVKSEHDVFARFKTLSAGKTSIVISHRMSTVRMADQIVHLENGRVTESGSHEELIRLAGAYSALFEIQAGSYR